MGSGIGGTPRPRDLYPQTPQSQVFLLVLLSFLLFAVSGKNAQQVVTGKLNALRKVPQPQPSNPVVGSLTLGNLIGWGATFLILTTLVDLPPTQKLAQGMTWLLFVGSLGAFGEPALNNVSGIAGGASPAKTAATTPTKPTSGTGATGATRVGGTGGT